MVDSSLSAVIADDSRPPSRPAIAPRTAAALEWQISVSTESLPARVLAAREGSPDYRRRLINDLLVPWQILTTFDEHSRADAAKFQAALKPRDEDAPPRRCPSRSTRSRAVLDG